MNLELLQQIGLNLTQAKAYISLIKYGSLTPPRLAKFNGETRTNAYMVLDKLVELELAIKDTHNKKLSYRVGNPVALEKLAKLHRDEAMQREKLVKESMPTLLNYFYAHSEQPGVRFFQGKEGLKEIYNDTLRTNKEVNLLRSPNDAAFMDEEYMARYKTKRAKAGIRTNWLGSDHPSATHDDEHDKLHNMHRKWLPKDAYTAPVEIDIYGDKVALLSFGEEAIGMIIESPQIADAMRQLYALAQAGAKT